MKKVLSLWLVIMVISVSLWGCGGGEKRSITAFCGSASKPAMEEAAQAFTERTGIEVLLNFSGSGTMLAQMKVDMRKVC